MANSNINILGVTIHWIVSLINMFQHETKDVNSINHNLTAITFKLVGSET